MNCKICSHKSDRIFISKILGKYDVSYFRCDKCLFIQTEEPFWLAEAYSSGAISALDVGIMSRNLRLLNKTQNILRRLFSDFTNFSAVDYGGGHGIFVRMMRDKGFNFYRQDLHAENLYARYFDIDDLLGKHKFNILTAFEVFEHLPNPIVEITKMFSHSDIILLSTELQPSTDISRLKDWWYIGQESGQHISFYTKDSFLKIAKETDSYYYTDSVNLHILSKMKLPLDPFSEDQRSLIKKSIIQKIVAKLNSKFNPANIKSQKNCLPESLMMTDFEYIKQKIKNDEFS